jgi:hypothetical protein
MPRFLRRLTPLLLGALAGLLAVPALADPPGRVGRLSDIAGIVSFHDSGDQQWSPAALNYPVTSGNSFWTEPNSRAEIHVGSTAIHLDAATELDVTALDDQRFDATLPQGTINIRVFRFNNGDGYNIATPRGTVTLASPGTYRISAGTTSDPTQVAVLDGAARIVDPNATVSLTRGEEALLTGSDTIDYQITEARPTPFDNASLARERREDEPVRASARYVSPEMTGYQDLDDHGSWRTEPAYGAVWYPQAVPVDWAPYRYGHWRWVAPWGWTWIDDQPWGFAPFHYGRWAYIGDRWGWTPGVIAARPVYAPALVAFIGGADWSLSLPRRDEPAVGWFPLAPREVYVPSYPASVTYVRNVNVTNVTNITNITNQTIINANGGGDANAANGRHANQRFATVVPQTAFVGARPVAAAAIAVPTNAVATAPVAAAPPITPAAAAASGHPEAVTRATKLAQAQGQRLTPAQQAAPLPPAGAEPGKAAPGPAIAGNRAPNANAARTGQGSFTPQQPGAPAATAPNAAPTVPAQGKPPVAAAPGPPIAAHEGPSTPPAGQGALTPADGARPEPARGGTPPAAAPGPPIRQAGPTTGQGGQARLAEPQAATPSEAKPPVPAAPGPPINRTTRPVPAEAAPGPIATAPSTPVPTAPRPPVQPQAHAVATPAPAAVARQRPAPAFAPAAAPARPAVTARAPAPPERPVARPVQQPVL